MKCTRCKKQAEVELKSHNAAFCRDCFNLFFLNQVQKAIKTFNMFTKKDRILVAVSGGKDSLTLWDVLISLGYRADGLFIHLGIEGFSNVALMKVRKFADERGAKVIEVNLTDEGLAIPKVKEKTRRVVCSLCGQIKRYYFNMVGLKNNYDVLATGHNLDDEASRLFSNVLHWKMDYLKEQSPALPSEDGLLKKVKPLCRLTEFETSVYAFFKKIDYVDISCPFSKGATFTTYKKHLNSIEYHSPGTKIDFYQGFLKKLRPILEEKREEKKNLCRICGYPTFSDICSICRLKGLS